MARGGIGKFYFSGLPTGEYEVHIVIYDDCTGISFTLVDFTLTAHAR